MRMIRLFIKVYVASLKRHLIPQFFELGMKLSADDLFFNWATIGF